MLNLKRCLAGLLCILMLYNSIDNTEILVLADSLESQEQGAISDGTGIAEDFEVSKINEDNETTDASDIGTSDCPTFVVTFEYNGGTIPADGIQYTYELGMAIAEPEEPVRGGTASLDGMRTKNLL